MCSSTVKVGLDGFSVLCPPASLLPPTIPRCTRTREWQASVDHRDFGHPIVAGPAGLSFAELALV